ncbi:MAG: PqqD family protein [Solirubrobacteraceae bacterium]|nr:PqqD family protein [Solirubrobacteraceae bacterium]
MGPAEGRLHLRDGGVDWKVLEDETIVLDLRGSRYFSINATGTLLWPLLAEGATRAQLVAAVTGRWEISAADAGRDVDAFCAELEAAGLLER